jgi:trans-AT polyketide synthase/acyltransferase/oxidoreductase domain-containing protein
MQPAREQFQSYLQAFAFSPLRIPVISNVEARPYTDDRIGALLADQLIRPVRWTESIAFLLGQGNISLKEVGPGDVLTKLIYSIQKDEAMPVL